MSCEIWQSFESDQRAENARWNAGVAQCHRVSIAMLSVLHVIAMSRLTLYGRFRVVKTYFENGLSVRATHRSLCAFYGPHNCPSFSW